MDDPMKNKYGVPWLFVHEANAARNAGFPLVCLLCGTGLTKENEEHECDRRHVCDTAEQEIMQDTTEDHRPGCPMRLEALGAKTGGFCTCGAVGR